MMPRDGAVAINACPSSNSVRQADACGGVPLHALRPRIRNAGEESHACCSP